MTNYYFQWIMFVAQWWCYLIVGANVAKAFWVSRPEQIIRLQWQPVQ